MHDDELFVMESNFWLCENQNTKKELAGDELVMKGHPELVNISL